MNIFFRFLVVYLIEVDFFVYFILVNILQQSEGRGRYENQFFCMKLNSKEIWKMYSSVMFFVNFFWEKSYFLNKIVIYISM